MEFRELNNQDRSMDIIQDLNDEYEQLKRSLNEVNLMLEQSRVEMGKLTQRNSVIASHLQQVQSQFETMPRTDIKMAYNAALDSQQRLLVMRSQLEKLQNDQSHMQKMLSILEKIRKSASSFSPQLMTQGTQTSTLVLEKVINAQESERQKLSRQMHDGPAQTLSNFILQADIVARSFESDPEKAKEELNNLKTSAMGTFQRVRDFIFDLRPMMLDDLGLFPTIRRYVDAFKEKNSVETYLEIQGQERRVESYIEVMIFRALQELLENAVVHNQNNPVKLAIEIRIYTEEHMIKVSVSDNGKGFNPDAIPDHSLGLKLIQERVEMCGGSLEIDSAVGQGCKISFQIPTLDK